MRRLEWVGSGDADGHLVDERVDGATLGDFAHGDTEALLATEPRLATIARLVERAAPMDEALWREVAILVAAFVGQGRRVPQIGAVTNESARVAPLLSGETTRLRLMAALRKVAR